MTTTGLPLGIDEGKPSSRVLRPPGGASSFSLGDTPPAPQQLRQSASEASPAAATPPAKTVEPTGTPDNPQAEGKSAAFKPNTNSHARIFGGSESASPSRGRDLSKGASAFNPITGEAYPGFEHSLPDLDGLRFNGRSPSRASNPITGEQEKTVAAQSQSSGKVRQPPGGFSQGIF